MSRSIANSETEARDVFLIISDSLRADTAREYMPFLQSLADDGFAVTDAQVAGAGTPSSMPAIMQSRLPIEHGGYGLRLPPEPPTLAETLSDDGFATLGLHSNAYTTADAGFGRGFEDFADLGGLRSDPLAFDEATDETGSESGGSNSDSTPLRARARDIADTLHLRKLGDRGMEPLKRHGLVESDPRADGRVLFESLMNWRSKRADASGRFAWLQLMDTHLPYLPPKEYRVAVDGAPETFRETYDLWQALTNRPESLTDDQARRIYKLYAAEARYVDALLREFVEGLKSSGAWEETLLVFTADHGELFRDREVPYGLNLKHPNYLCEELTHVPLIFAGGAVADQEPVERPTSGMDIAPTVADALDLNVPSSWQGEIIGSEAHDDRRFITSAIAHTRGSGVSISEDALHVAVRDESRALLWWRSRDGKECYDRTENGEVTVRCGEAFGELIATAEDTASRLDDVSHDPEADVGGAVSERLHDLGYVE